MSTLTALVFTLAQIDLFAQDAAQVARELVQAEPPAQETPAQEPPREIPSVDFDWLEINPRIGVAIFSEDYHVDASPCIALMLRAPLTFLSPASNPEGDYFGFFTQLTLAFIKRDIEPELDKPSGPIALLTFGVDYTFYRSDSWLFILQAGTQYGSYLGITDLNDGFAPMVGITVGLNVAPGFNLTYNPEAVFGRAGDRIYLNYLGLVVEF